MTKDPKVRMATKVRDTGPKGSIRPWEHPTKGGKQMPGYTPKKEGRAVKRDYGKGGS